MNRNLACGLALAAAILGGCGDGGGGGGGGEAAGAERFQIVATTGIAGDLVRAVAADTARVAVLIPPGADPHAYEPRPDDLKALASAKLIVSSGGEIDEWLDGAIAAAGADGAERVVLLDATNIGEAAAPADGGQAAGHAGDVDPHWWHDPRAALFAIEAIKMALEESAPTGADAYAKGAAALRGELEQLDEGIETCLGRLPEGRRKIVTSHDALGPYARRYDLDVIGTVIPGRSTQARASSGAIADLVALIRREQVPAVFPDGAVDPKVERAVADEAGATVAPPLYTDGLGPKGSGAETYLGMLRHNTTTIVRALGGEPCTLP